MLLILISISTSIYFQGSDLATTPFHVTVDVANGLETLDENSDPDNIYMLVTFSTVVAWYKLTVHLTYKQKNISYTNWFKRYAF